MYDPSSKETPRKKKMISCQRRKTPPMGRREGRTRRFL
jgi:hypothetical protein